MRKLSESAYVSVSERVCECESKLSECIYELE